MIDNQDGETTELDGQGFVQLEPRGGFKTGDLGEQIYEHKESRFFFENLGKSGVFRYLDTKILHFPSENRELSWKA